MKLLTITLFYLLSGSSYGATVTGFHKCPEGHVCIYKRGGAKLDRLEEPGWHWHEPLLTSVHPIQVTWQTDTVKDVVCGSSKGGTARLDIAVINKLEKTPECIDKVIKNYGIDYDKPLIFDYVPSEVLQFCKNYDLDQIYTSKIDELDEVLLEKLRDNVKSYGLEECLTIKGVRMDRPKLSQEMQQQFERTESLKKEQEHAKEEAKTAEIKSKTQLAQAEAAAHRVQTTKKYEMETELLQARNNADIQEIENEKEKKKIESRAEAEATARKKLAEANKALHTPEFLELEHYKAYYNNAKIHTAPPEMLKNSHNLVHTNMVHPSPSPTSHPPSTPIVDHLHEKN